MHKLFLFPGLVLILSAAGTLLGQQGSDAQVAATATPRPLVGTSAPDDHFFSTVNGPSFPNHLAGSLPQVSWLMMNESVSDHTPHSSFAGENWTVTMLNSLMRSSLCTSSVSVVDLNLDYSQRQSGEMVKV